jgi:hypothetical protein
LKKEKIMTFLYVAFGLMCLFVGLRIAKLFSEGTGKILLQFAQLTCVVGSGILCAYALSKGFSGTFLWLATVFSFILCITLIIGIIVGFQESISGAVFTFVDWVLAIAVVVFLVFVCFIS